jgi:pimeloyl-ACP methyl ester carboxylesterase
VVDLCSEAFGDPSDAPILLIHGVGASMLWWDESFCRLLADRGRYVIRYDHRDTGRSATSEPGRPDYTGADLTADAARVLDDHDVPAASLVGVSAGGGMAQDLALEHPDRVTALALISTSPVVAIGRDLPPPTDAFLEALPTLTVDWSDTDSVIEYLIDYSRVLNGDVRPFDEAAARALVTEDVRRARNPAAAQNHDLLEEGSEVTGPLSRITVPTVVVHGTADPMFPIEHGQALADEIPGATLVTLDGAGHGVDRRDWPTIVDAITGA